MQDPVIIKEDLTKRPFQLSVRAHKAYRMIYFLLGITEAFLLIRFLFKLFGAEPHSWFAVFIYGISGILLLPFYGIFHNAAPAGPGVTRVFEPSTLVACLIYLLLAFFASRLLLILHSKPVEKE